MTAKPDLAVLDTLPKLLAFNAANFPADIALREKDLGIWRATSWRAYHARVKAMALGFRAIDLAKGDIIAMIGDNRPDWVCAEIAAHGARKPTQVLHPDGVVQPHLDAHRFERVRRRIFAQHHDGGVGRQDLGDREDEQRHDEQRIADQRDPLEDVGRRHADARPVQPRFGAPAPNETRSSRNTAPRGCSV